MSNICESLEHCPPRERDGLLFERLSAHLAKAYAGSREVKARMDRAGVKPADVANWDVFARIPVIRKKDLVPLQAAGSRLGGLLTVELGELRRIYQSPGPIYDPEGRSSDYWGWAEAFKAAGFGAGDLVQMTFSYHLTPAGHMLEEPLHHLGCAVIPAGPGNTEAQIELMTRLPVTGFVGMTSYLKTIGEKARSMGLDLRKDFSLKTAFVAAERLPETLRHEVESMFGITIRQGYGTADVGAIAYECRALGGMHAVSRGVTEICDPATGLPVDGGEIGEVVFTPFCGAYPLVRLATGDLSRFVIEPCPCGRTSPKLAGILGRADDTAKVKGQFVYPSQAAEALAGVAGIAAWLIHVDNPGGMDRITLVYASETEVDEEALAEAFRARCKLRPGVRRAQTGEIDPAGPRIKDERRFE
jgi:phenylacetate-CoA ligase